MKKYVPWIKAMRLSVTIPCGLLVHIGFKLAGMPTNWWLAAWVLVGASLAMLHNDYVDRTHDLKKNRTFATENADRLKAVLIGGWIVLFFGSLLAFAPYASLLLPVILISILYSYCREIVLVQAICVAFASASPILMTASGAHPLASITPNSVFFFVVFIAVLGREMIKDIEDQAIDRGYKATLVSTGLQSIPVAYKEASYATLSSAGILIFMMMTWATHPSIPVLVLFGIGWIGVVCSGYWWHIEHNAAKGKKFFDGGMMFVFASIILY